MAQDQVRQPLEHASETQHAVAMAGCSPYLLLIVLQAFLGKGKGCCLLCLLQLAHLLTQDSCQYRSWSL